MPALSAKNIVKAIAAETGRTGTFELVKGEGYWYFTYTTFNAEGKVVRYDTHSVYTMYLSNLDFDGWMYEARAFTDHLTAEDRLYGETV